MEEEVLKRDENRVTVLGGVTDDSNEYVTMLRVDPTTKRLLVASTGISGAGITNLNGLVEAAQTFSASDGANVTLTITSLVDNHEFAIGWDGQLSIDKGGTGLAVLGSSNFLLGMNNDADAMEYKELVAGTGVTITNLPGQILIDSTGAGIVSLNGLTDATQTFVNDTNVTIVSSGTTHTITWVSTLATSRGGLGIALADPNADRILFWDDSAGNYAYLTAGSGLTITGTTITATGGGGGDVSSVSNSDGTLIISPTTGAVVASLDESFDFNFTGDITFSPLPTSSDTPTISTQLTNKAYVDTFALGLSVRASTRVATTANLTATYANGTAGVGATLTNSGALAAISIDGVALSANDRVLVKNQTSQLENGIYTVTTVGSGAVAWVLTRATDYDQSAEVVTGTFTSVLDGTQQNTQWVMDASGTITMGTTAITWSKLSNSLTSVITDGVYITGDGTIGDPITISSLPITGATGKLLWNDSGTLNVLTNSSYIPGTSLTIGADDSTSDFGDDLYITAGDSTVDTGGNLYITGGTGIGGSASVMYITAGSNSDVPYATGGSITGISASSFGGGEGVGGSFDLQSGQMSDNATFVAYGGRLSSQPGAYSSSVYTGGVMYMNGGAVADFAIDPFANIDGGILSASGASLTSSGSVVIASGDVNSLYTGIDSGDVNISIGSPSPGGTAGKIKLTGFTQFLSYTVATGGTPAYLLAVDSSGNLITTAGSGGSGDVVGPASSTDNAIARYDGVTGKLIQNSGLTLDDSVSGTTYITATATNENLGLRPNGSGVIVVSNAGNTNVGIVLNYNITGGFIGAGTLGAGGSTVNNMLGSSQTRPVLSWGAAGTVANYFGFTSTATTADPVMRSQGSDTNIGITIETKGTGNLKLKQDSSSLGAILNVSSIATSNKTFTFPNATGTFALTNTPGTTGTDINWSATGTLNVPNASATARGVVSTGGQTFGGNKTFNGEVLLSASTAARASLNIPVGVIPTTPVNGDIWHDTSRGNLQGYIGSLRHAFVGKIYTAVAIQTVTNTVTETTLFSSGSSAVGTLILPANFLNTSRTIDIKMRGALTTPGVSNSIVLNLKLNSTNILTRTISLPLSLTSAYYEIDAMGTMYSSGVSAIIYAYYTIRIIDSSGAETRSFRLNTTTPIDTTIAQTIDMTVTWDSASATREIRNGFATVTIT